MSWARSMRLWSAEISGNASRHRVRPLVSLRELAKTCNFCNYNCLQNNFYGQVVEGLIDTDTVQDLLNNLTLKKAINTCQVMEAAKKELQSRPGASTSALDSELSESVNAVTFNPASSESINRYKHSRAKNGGWQHP